MMLANESILSTLGKMLSSCVSILPATAVARQESKPGDNLKSEESVPYQNVKSIYIAHSPTTPT